MSGYVEVSDDRSFISLLFTHLISILSILFYSTYILVLFTIYLPGRGNQEVMQFVTGGGRLSTPNNSTPAVVYSLMLECWNNNPDLRPSFATIMERIGACLVDGTILETPLPLFSRVPTSSEDTTLMRPPPGSTDYLVPTNPSPTYSLSSEKTELLSPDTCSTVTGSTVTNEDAKLLELLDDPQSSGSGILHPHRPLWKKQSITSSVSQGNKQHSESGISSGNTAIPETSEENKNPNRYVNV